LATNFRERSEPKSRCVLPHKLASWPLYGGRSVPHNLATASAAWRSSVSAPLKPSRTSSVGTGRPPPSANCGLARTTPNVPDSGLLEWPAIPQRMAVIREKRPRRKLELVTFNRPTPLG